MADEKSLTEHYLDLARQKWGEDWFKPTLKPLAPAFSELIDDAAPRDVVDIDLRWHVLLTEPNCEKRAADRLQKMGFKPYVPTFMKLTNYTVRSMFGAVRRQRTVERPLFPGYLFMPLNIAWSFGPLYDVSGLRVGERRNISPFLKINGEFAIVPEAAMAIIRDVTHKINNPLDHGLPYKVGDTVRILDGSFADRFAQIGTLDDAERIMLLIDLLGQKTKVFVSSRQITAA